MCTQLVQATQASIEAVSDSEPSIFLQWVWLESESIGPHPPNKPVSRFFGLARLAGLLEGRGGEREGKGRGKRGLIY